MMVGRAFVTTVEDSIATNMPINRPDRDCMICLCDMLPTSPACAGGCTCLLSFWPAACRGEYLVVLVISSGSRGCTAMLRQRNFCSLGCTDPVGTVHVQRREGTWALSDASWCGPVDPQSDHRRVFAPDPSAAGC